MRGLKNGCKQLIAQLNGLYGRTAGELLWLETPPKSMNRAWRGRDAFEAESELRAERLALLRDLVPQIEAVLRYLDADWSPADAKIVKPHRSQKGKVPSVGWTEAAFEVLRQSAEPLSIAEIASLVCQHYDISFETVAQTQRAHTAINNALVNRNRHLLISDDGAPARWRLAR